MSVSEFKDIADGALVDRRSLLAATMTEAGLSTSKRTLMGPLLESDLISEIARSLVVAGCLLRFSLLLELRKAVLQCRSARRFLRGILL